MVKQMEEDLLERTIIYKWEKGELDHIEVKHPKGAIKEVLKQYPGYTIAEPIGKTCPEPHCDGDLLDYGFQNSKEGIIEIFQCSNCNHVEYELKYTPEETRILGELLKPRTHCGKKMKVDWSYCPYCGEELY